MTSPATFLVLVPRPNPKTLALHQPIVVHGAGLLLTHDARILCTPGARSRTRVVSDLADARTLRTRAGKAPRVPASRMWPWGREHGAWDPDASVGLASSGMRMWVWLWVSIESWDAEGARAGRAVYKTPRGRLGGLQALASQSLASS